MPRRKSTPSYRLHKQSGQAVVTLTDSIGLRKDFLLGKFDTSESRAEYIRVISQWEAAGRRLPGTTPGPEGITVNELLARYAVHAEGYYVKNGQPTKQLERVKRSLRFVTELYGTALVRDFGPLALKAVRERMMAHDWTRIHVNHCVGCIKRCFKWGVENELVHPTVYQALACVAGLRKGRSAAREGTRIRPVADEHVQAVLPFLTVPIQAMVQLQRLTGMRPGEVVIMRPRDIDRSQDKVWVYRPESHKTEHHGTDRVVVLGPQAQKILKPFLHRDADAYLFCPAEAMALRSKKLRSNRKTPVQPSQQNRRRRHPRKSPGVSYRGDTYGHAIAAGIRRANTARACDSCKKLPPAHRCEKCKAAAIPHWHVHQLRHSAATVIRKRFGLDAAQVTLGHASASITEIYAERDLTLAEKVAREIG